MCSSADLGSVTQLSFIKEAFALFFFLITVLFMSKLSAGCHHSVGYSA